MRGRGIAVFQFSILSLLAAFAVIISSPATSSIAGKTDAGAQPALGGRHECPSPAVYEGGKCVLTQNESLHHSLEMSSNTILDCRGYKLTPAAEGKEASQNNPSIPSIPVAGIFLNGVANVTVQNCAVMGFDFGIVIVNGKKGGEGNNILNNFISSLNQGVTIVQSDNNIVRGNTIEFRSRGSGAGVMVWQDSDFNHIEKNTITSPPTASVFPSPGYPGGKDLAFSNSSGMLADPDGRGSVTGITGGDGVAFVSFPQIPDFQIEETALQFVRYPADRAQGNTVEENVIGIKGVPNIKTYSAAVEISSYQSGTVIRKNVITEGDYAMRLAPYEDLAFGLDFTEEAYTRDILIEDNRIDGKFASAPLIALRATINTVVRGNFIRLKGSDNSGVGVGIGGPSLETATVAHNRIENFKYGIRLGMRNLEGGVLARLFGAKIFLNDIIKSRQAVSVSEGYIFATELSVNGRGNYWERSCDDSGGFREFGEPNPDSPSFLVIDSHPYGRPVAGKSDEALLEIEPCLE